MTSSLANSPALSRISVDHPSIATTVSARSSDLGSPIIGSPTTSGSLSPFGLGGTSRESVKVMLKHIRSQKKLVMLAHPVFSTEEQVLSWKKFEEFQKHEQQIKSTQAMENDEKKPPGKEVSPSLSSSAPTSVFNEDVEELYFKDFPIKTKATKEKTNLMALKTLPLLSVAGSISQHHSNTTPINVHVAASAVCRDNRNVTAYEIGDSIAVFCLSEKEVIVHHVSSALTTKEDVCKQFEKISRDKAAIYHIYIVGGDGSRESDKLLRKINLAIQDFFGDKGLVKETFSNPNCDFGMDYVSVVFTNRRKFFFCRHD